MVKKTKKKKAAKTIKKVVKARAARKKAGKVVPAKIAVGEPVVSQIGKYFAAIGRRKEAVAMVRLSTGSNDLMVNGKSVAVYFPVLELQKIVMAPFLTMNVSAKIGGTVKVRGGGLRGQAEAIRLGISRALVKFNPDFQKRLKRIGFLTRDARVKERKKYGLKKARRAPQWQKR